MLFVAPSTGVIGQARGLESQTLRKSRSYTIKNEVSRTLETVGHHFIYRLRVLCIHIREDCQIMPDD